MLDLIRDIKINDLLDIFIVSLLIYNFLRLISNTRAFQILAGIFVLIIPLAISPWYPLPTINWILRHLFQIGILSLIIIFQSEIRKALAQLGQTSSFMGHRMSAFYSDFPKMVDEIISALNILAKNKIGAIIVFEHSTGLQNFIDTGLPMDSKVTRDLLITIFTPPSLLHDGAIIISGSRIKAASCVLPLTDRSDLQLHLGTRHRAAIGISEISDALSIVVSEERGEISYCLNGKIYRNQELDVLSRLIKRIYAPRPWWKDKIVYKIKRQEK